MSDIDFGQLSEALNDKSDRDLRNVDITAKADAIIDFQLPTADNGYTWYRLYASGWVEQGGIFDFGSNSSTNPWNVTLPVAMADTMYIVNATSGGNTSQGKYGSYVAINNAGKTTTTFGGFMWSVESGGIRYINWQVSGLSAN